MGDSLLVLNRAWLSVLVGERLRLKRRNQGGNALKD